MNRVLTSLTVLALLGFALPAIADEGDGETEEDEFSFLEEGDKAAEAAKAAAIDANDFSLDDEEEDLSGFELAAPAERPRMSAPSSRPGALPYDLVGKDPLADNYPPQVLFVDRDSVVVELPVLLTREPGDWEGRSFWLVTQVTADGMKVAETRQEFTRSSLAQAGPTMAFIKVLAPVPADSGTLELSVGRATSPGGTPQPLFSKPVSYKLQ